MSAYFSEAFMTARKQEFVDSLGSMQVNIGSAENPNWITGEVIKQLVDTDGNMIFQCAFADTTEEECAVSQIKLCDQLGDTAAIMDKAIVTAYGQGVYVTVKIRMIETEWEIV